MKRLNHWIRTSMGFSQSEANGLLILLPSVLLFVASPFVYKHYIYQPSKIQFDYIYMDSTLSVLKEHIILDSIVRAEERQKYYADKYKNKKYNEFSKKGNKKFEYTERSHVANIKTKLQPFDINLADTSILKNVRGIGTVLSTRIIKYRDWLGGFTSKDQLKEVFGLKDSVLMSLDTLTFIGKEFKPKAIQINVLGSKELKKHPYMTPSLANAIDAYKFQHGFIASVDDLKMIKLLDSATLQKLSPYLDFSSDKD